MELLVVMAIIGLLGAVSVPAFFRYLPQDNLAGTTRELYSRLKGAQVHAVTFRKNAGVVYVFDNYAPPGAGGGLGEPITDTLTGNVARVIVGTAMVGKIREGPFAGYYAPVEGRDGQWTEFPHDVCLLPIDATGSTVEVPYEYLYTRQTPGYESPGITNDDKYETASLLAEELGMRDVAVIPDLETAEAEVKERLANGESVDLAEYAVWFPGHIFKPRGSMLTSGQAERFTIHMGLRPNQPVDDRAIELPDGPRQLRTRALQLYKSTGRVKDAQ